MFLRPQCPVSLQPPLSPGHLTRNCTLTANAECACPQGWQCRDTECTECDMAPERSPTPQLSRAPGPRPRPTLLPYTKSKCQAPLCPVTAGKGHLQPATSFQVHPHVLPGQPVSAFPSQTAPPGPQAVSLAFPCGAPGCSPPSVFAETPEARTARRLQALTDVRQPAPALSTPWPREFSPHSRPQGECIQEPRREDSQKAPRSEKKKRKRRV